MQAREAPDFWGLHKNKNCAFPLMTFPMISIILPSMLMILLPSLNEIKLVICGNN